MKERNDWSESSTFWDEDYLDGFLNSIRQECYIAWKEGFLPDVTCEMSFTYDEDEED